MLSESHCSTNGGGASGSSRYHSNHCHSRIHSSCCSLDNSNCHSCSSIRSGSIHTGSYCTDCTDYTDCRDYRRDCCKDLEGNMFLPHLNSLVGSNYCSLDSNFHRCMNNLVGKGRIARRPDYCLLQIPLRQERRLALILRHHASSKSRISPLRHYCL